MGIEKESTACILASKYLFIAPIAPIAPITPITPTSPTFAPTISTVSSQTDPNSKPAYLGLNLVDFFLTVTLIGFFIITLFTILMYMYLRKDFTVDKDVDFTHVSDLYPDRSKSDEWIVQVVYECMSV